MEENPARTALERMPEEKLEKLILDLAKFAITTGRFYFWRTGNPNYLPKGETPESVVSLALEKVLQNKRKWNPQKNPDLRGYLMDVVADLIGKLSRSKDNTALVAEPEEGTEHHSTWEAGSNNSESQLDWLSRRGLSPEEILIAKEQENQFCRAYDMLLHLAESDPVVLKIIEANENGVVKSESIASRTGIDVREIYLATRRLERMIKRVTREMSQQPATDLPSGTTGRTSRRKEQ